MIRKLLRKFGFDIIRNRGTRTTMYDALQHIKSKGFNPQTIIDVGVANGTLALYDAFPNAKFILVEPLHEFEPALQFILRRVTGSYELIAASKESGFSIINVKPTLSTSTMKKAEIVGENRTIPTDSLDNICRRQGFSTPLLIKIDTEGNEIDVLAGCEALLDVAEVIILEMCFVTTLKGAPEFFEILNYMNKKDFVLYDIFDLRNREIDRALSQADGLFVKKNGLFRDAI